MFKLIIVILLCTVYIWFGYKLIKATFLSVKNSRKEKIERKQKNAQREEYYRERERKQKEENEKIKAYKTERAWIDEEMKKSKSRYHWQEAFRRFEGGQVRRYKSEYEMVELVYLVKELVCRIGFPPTYTLFQNGYPSWVDEIPEDAREYFAEAVRHYAAIELEEHEQEHWKKIQKESHYAFRPVVTESGEAGETNVQYLIEWWAKTHNSIVIKKNCKSKYSDHCIRLANWDVINEPQEFDHLLVTPYGVVHIETKEYTTDIEVIDTDTWKKYGQVSASPAAQVRRHEYILKSFLGDIDVISGICMANENCRILEPQKSEIPIFSIRTLDKSLEELTKGKPERFDEATRLGIAEMIERRKVMN